MAEEDLASQVARQENQPEAPDAGLTVRVDQFHGPLPPPDFFEQYEATLPGAAERILQMAERQAAHRQGAETFALARESRRADMGLILGTLAAVAVLALAGYAFFLGEPVIGGLVGVAPIASIVGAYLHGTRVKKRDQEE